MDPCPTKLISFRIVMIDSIVDVALVALDKRKPSGRKLGFG
jgi:hypothetical protein